MDKEKDKEGGPDTTVETSVDENTTLGKRAASTTTLEVEKSEDGPAKKQRKKSNKSAACWDLFEIIPGTNEGSCQCMGCGIIYACDKQIHGTSNLNKHIRKGCPGLKDEKQALLNLKGGVGDEGSVLSTWKYDKDACRKALAYMMIIHELPFRFVEGEGFRRFVASLQPRFNVPSRITVAKDCYELFLDERINLMDILKANTSRVAITTDTWTSVQRINYMCLTAHYIDSKWNIQKKILNFCPITSHKGDAIGMAVEQCLNSWGIENLMTVTVDNAASNDVAINYLKQTWKGTVLRGEYLHMRCIAHIMNLVVQDGLKLASDSVVRVRNAVRYIRSSPARFLKFKTCIDLEKIEFKGQLCLDVPTRWNSTYLMLETALKLRKAFDRFVFHDSKYVSAMLDCDDSALGRPLDADWNSVEGMVKLLATFYQLTLRVSGSSYVTANTYFNEISSVFVMLNKLASDESVGQFGVMCQKMRKKCDKYWGDPEKMNVMIFIAAVYDPHFKFGYVQYGVKMLYSVDVANRLIDKVKNAMKDLFEEYRLKYSSSTSKTRTGIKDGIHGSVSGSCSSTSTITCLIDSDSHSLMNQYLQLKVTSHSEGKSELDKYLDEDVEDIGEGGQNSSLKILNWWKVNSPRFPILGLLARDVLGIPVSTVASESAFSTGGRVLDQYRSSLAPRMVEALVCTQDWLRKDKDAVTLEEHLSEIEKIDEELKIVDNAPNIIDIDV